ASSITTISGSFSPTPRKRARSSSSSSLHATPAKWPGGKKTSSTLSRSAIANYSPNNVLAGCTSRNTPTRYSPAITRDCFYQRRPKPRFRCPTFREQFKMLFGPLTELFQFTLDTLYHCYRAHEDE